MSAPRRSISAESSGHTDTHSISYSPRSDGRNSILTPPTGSQPYYGSPAAQKRRDAYDDARARFRSLRKEYQRAAADGRTYVLVNALAAELRRTGVMEDMRNSTNEYLRPFSTPIVAKAGLPEYTIIFCILVEIGFPRLFRVFRNHSVNDALIPLSRHRLARLKSEQDRELPGFVDKFLEEQLAWCPISFSSDMCLDQRNCIEPFCYQSSIRSSRKDRPHPQNNASLFEVHVSEELLSEATCRMLEDLDACITPHTETETTVASESSVSDGKCYRLALKRFPSNKRQTFEREKLAFEALRDQDGLIRYIAAYQTTNKKQETHYNILLEYAELDLYHVFRKEEPPVSPDKIKAFWEAMLGLCRVLEAIRTVKLDDEPFDVYHCDIKPENILRTGGRFKLADLGETRIQKSEPDEEPKARITGGTMTYASPEKAAWLNSPARQPPLVNQNSDIWSLGAVLSNAATYVVLGKQGVLKYNLVRRSAVKEATSKAGDGFHDGDRVFKAVTQWHTYLRNCSRRYDDITPAILNLVDQHMLVSSQNRYNSAKTASCLESILNDTTLGLPQVPPLIKRMLEEIEDDPESFRERSTDSTVTSLGTISAGDNVYDDISLSKYDLLNQRILPTAPQGSQGRRRNTANNTLTRTNTLSTTRTGFSLERISTSATAARSPEEGRGSYEEFYEPYTVFKMREALDELEEDPRSIGGMFGRRTSFFRSRQASVKGKWKAHEDQLVDAFKGRDIVFLVDNGSTMVVHWQEATELLTTLIRRAIGYDDDGIELYFTSQENMQESAVPLRKQRVEDFTRAMGEARPAGKSYLSQPTDIVPLLSTVMGKYIYEKKKPKTIIVLTDGRWEGMRDELAVDALIIGNLNQLRTIHPDTAANGNLSAIEEIRPLTIQFIRFGQHPEASDRLRRLDDCLVDHGVEDMVDCEPSGGDVYKMFLGSLLKEMDEKVNITNMLSPSTPSLSRGPSLRNGNHGTDDDGGDDGSFT